MNKRWVVSPFALLHWTDGRPQLAAGADPGSSDCDLLALLGAFASPSTIQEVRIAFSNVPSETWERVVLALTAEGVLVPAGATEPPARAHWNALAWAYHRLSRRPVTFRPTAQAEAPSPPVERQEISLPRSLCRPPTKDVFALLDARRSVRAWSTAPIAFELLSDLLWFCARDRDAGGRDAGGNAVSGLSRPYPSGGAAYTLELYPVVGPSAVQGLDAGIYRYLPQRHGLEAVFVDADEAAGLLSVLGHALAAGRSPPLGIVVTSRIARQTELYAALAYSLVLKEVGALMQTFHLAAAGLGLGMCALGGGTPWRRFEALRGVTDADEPVVGEFVFGVPDEPVPMPTPPSTRDPGKRSRG